MSKEAFREKVAREMIEQMEKGTAPWVKPWKAAQIIEQPFNPSTGKSYRGINTVWLSMQGYADPRWMTYKQAKENNAQVRRGAQSTQIEFWNFYKNIDLVDEQGKPLLDEKGKALKRRVALERPYPVYANVFNAEQIEGLEPYQVPVISEAESIQKIQEIENLLQSTAVPIHFDQANRAFYAPLKDEIHLPPVDSFNGQYEYYATALHEMGHASGHESRLARDMTNPFGSREYAYEELRAEIASYMATTSLGLGHYPERHANYVESWLKAAKEDRHYLFRAANEAETIATWLLDPAQRPELEKRAQLKRENELRENRIPVILTEEEQQKRLQKIHAEEIALQQALKAEPAKEEIIERQNLGAVFHNTNTEGLTRVSNFFAARQEQDELPVYIQTRTPPTSSPEKANEVLQLADRILEGTLSQEQIRNLARLNVSLPEISYDKKTGLHEVHFTAFAVTETESRFWVEKDKRTDRVEFSFKGKDQKKTFQLAQTLINTTRALEVQKNKADIKEYIWLDITMENLVEARSKGVLFSPKEMKFYAPENMPRSQYEKWLPKEEEKDLAMNGSAAAQQGQKTSTAQEKLFQGILVDHGAAPYNNIKGNKENYFVTLEDDSGRQTTHWGIDFPRALEEAKAEKGQIIELINEGRKPVTVDQPIRDKDGNIIGSEKVETHRNKWTAILHGQDKANSIKQQAQPEQVTSPATGKEQNQEAAPADKEKQAERIYLQVPKEEREQVKRFGGRWDKERQLWHVPADQLKAAQAAGGWPLIENTNVSPEIVWDENIQKQFEKHIEGKTYINATVLEHEEALRIGADIDDQLEMYFVRDESLHLLAESTFSGLEERSVKSAYEVYLEENPTAIDPLKQTLTASAPEPAYQRFNVNDQGSVTFMAFTPGEGRPGKAAVQTIKDLDIPNLIQGDKLDKDFLSKLDLNEDIVLKGGGTTHHTYQLLGTLKGDTEVQLRIDVEDANKELARTYAIALHERIAQKQNKLLEPELSPAAAQSSSAEKSKSKVPAFEDRVFISVSYHDKEEAKKLGAYWHKKDKAWFTHKDNAAAIERFGKTSAPAPKLSPVEEFADFLRSHGVELKGSPVMDGKFHRVAIEGDKGKKNAEYKAFNDGRPAGFLKFHKGGEVVKWAATGQTMTAEEKAAFQAEMANKQLERAKERAQEHGKTAKAAFAIWQKTPDWANHRNSVYMKKKEVSGYLGLKVNQKGEILVPLRDAKGFLHNIQTISEDGKRFMPNGRKEGLFHSIGFVEKLKSEKLEKDKIQTIVIAEGIATGATLHMATNLPTVVAFDGGNLLPVAKELKKEFPNAKLIFAADNDHHLVNHPQVKKNVGLEKAHEAAQAVGGVVIEPTFKPSEKEKDLTDFNDLQIARGKDKASAEIKELVSSAIAPEKAREKSQDRSKASQRPLSNTRTEEAGMAL